MSPPRHSLLLILALTLCQCTTAGLSRKVIVGPEDRVTIIFYQRASRESGRLPRTTKGKEMKALTQTLVTEAVVTDRQTFYSDRRADQLTKVLPLEHMQLLLDSLSTAGFFDLARGQVMPGCSAYLQADVDGKSYILSRSADMDPTSRESFTRSFGAFLDIYNATQAYRAGDDNNRVIQEHEQRQRGFRIRRRLDQGGR